MAQKSAILPKKLRELESELADMFRIPLDPLPGPCHWISFDDVANRIEFLKNLLSYEEVTSQPHNFDQLHDIADKIATLETAFHEWDESRSSALGNFNDTLSMCSNCTHAILDGGAGLVHESETPVSAPEDLVGEKCFEEAEKPETEHSGKEARRIWRKIGNYCGIFWSGVIVGAICMVKLSSLLSMIDTEAFLLPTPT